MIPRYLVSINYPYTYRPILTSQKERFPRPLHLGENSKLAPGFGNMSDNNLANEAKVPLVR